MAEASASAATAPGAATDAPAIAIAAADIPAAVTGSKTQTGDRYQTFPPYSSTLDGEIEH